MSGKVVYFERILVRYLLFWGMLRKRLCSCNNNAVRSLYAILSIYNMLDFIKKIATVFSAKITLSPLNIEREPYRTPVVSELAAEPNTMNKNCH